MHYVSLSDCLYVEGITSEKYAPALSDRPALANLERSNWVPSKALDLVKDFTREHPNLNLPLQPFTVLLLQLNKVSLPLSHPRPPPPPPLSALSPLSPLSLSLSLSSLSPFSMTMTDLVLVCAQQMWKIKKKTKLKSKAKEVE